MIEFNKKFTVTVPATAVDERGRSRIKRILYSAYLPPLPEDWDWSRRIQEGEFRGKLPKRIATYYKKKHEERLSLELLTRIGNRVGQHSFDKKTYTLDFTKDLDWKAGDFGDGGSCFWSCRDLARNALVENGVIAVRFYCGRGYARAWVLQVECGLVIFNAYGLPCETITHVLATLFNYPYRNSVDFDIRGDMDGLIWLNEDAHRIGSEPFTNVVTTEFNVSYALCTDCDEFCSVDEGDHDNDGDFVCSICQAL